jgi:hypothetical protein
MGFGTRLTEREERDHQVQGGERTDRFTNALCTCFKAQETQENNEATILPGDAMEHRDFVWPGHHVSICVEAQPHHQLNYQL